jgi:hypothetical protein
LASKKDESGEEIEIKSFKSPKAGGEIMANHHRRSSSTNALNPL